MTQIKPNQIIPDSQSREKLVGSLPVELADTEQKNPAMPLASTTSGSSLTPISIDISDPDISSPPQTPYVKSIKSQSLNFQPDGTITIDVVLDVADVRGVSQYEVRVTKSTGSL